MLFSNFYISLTQLSKEKGWLFLLSRGRWHHAEVSSAVRPFVSERVHCCWFCRFSLKHEMGILFSQGVTAAVIGEARSSIEGKEQQASIHRTTVKWSTAKQKWFILIFEPSASTNSCQECKSKLHYGTFTAWVNSNYFHI